MVKGEKFSLVGSNLVVAYKEVKLFALLAQAYPQDFVDLLRSHFRFLDNTFHKLLQNVDIKQFCNSMNSSDEDLLFIFKNQSRTLNFPGVQLKVVGNTLVFDIY